MPDEEKRLQSILSGPATDVLGAAAGGLKKGISTTFEDVWMGLVGDRIRHWRATNLVNVAERTADLLKQKGIKPSDARGLPDGELFALFDGASKVEEPVLQQLWAHLLSERMRPEPENIDTEFCINILRSLSPIEADGFLLVARLESLQDKELIALKGLGDSSDGQKSKEELAGHESKLDRIRADFLSKYDQITEKSAIFCTDLEVLSKDGLIAKGLVEPLVVVLDGGNATDPFRSGRREDLGAFLGHLDKRQRGREQIERVQKEIIEGPLARRNEHGQIEILFRLTSTGRYLVKALEILDH